MQGFREISPQNMDNFVLVMYLRKFHELTNQHKNILDTNVVSTRIADDVNYAVQ
jgi:hypothetical protein